MSVRVKDSSSPWAIMWVTDDPAPNINVNWIAQTARKLLYWAVQDKRAGLGDLFRFLTRRVNIFLELLQPACISLFHIPWRGPQGTGLMCLMWVHPSLSSCYGPDTVGTSRYSSVWTWSWMVDGSGIRSTPLVWKRTSTCEKRGSPCQLGSL